MQNQNLEAINKNQDFLYHYKYFFTAPKPMEPKKSLLLYFDVTHAHGHVDDALTERKR